MENTMKRILASLIITTAVAVMTISLSTGTVKAQETPELPERFTANLDAMGTPRVGVVHFSITIERWSTEEERKSLLQALNDNGTEGLLEKMAKMDVGYMQIDNSLGWRLASASTWQTEKGRLVRVVTDRPIAIHESLRGTRSLEYPIGIIEFTLPADGPGEGALLGAAQLQFDKEGRIELKSLPLNTGPQMLKNVRKQKPKKKKKKKD
jgi:hypothetical protein